MHVDLARGRPTPSSSAVDPVPLRSVVNLGPVESVSVALLVERLGRLSDARMREVYAALGVVTDCR